MAKDNNIRREFSYTRPILYNGEAYPSADSMISDGNGNQTKGRIFADADGQYYTLDSNGSAVPVMTVNNLDEVNVSARNKQTLPSMFSDYLLANTDNVQVNNLPHREYNTNLQERGLRGAREHALWDKEHPNLSSWRDAATAAPLIAAAAPFIYGAGSAVTGTALGQATIGLMNNPIVNTANTALGLGFAAKGAYDISQGEFTPQTALELSGLYPMIKNSDKFANWLKEPGYNASKIEDTLLDNSLNSENGSTMPFSFKQDPLEMHKARAIVKGYDPSKVKVYNLSEVSDENTKFIEDYAKQSGISPEQAHKELLDYLNSHGHGAALPGENIVIHDGKSPNTSAMLSHEFDHALHIPDEPLSNDVFYPRVKKIHGDYFTRYNNTEASSRGSQLHDYYGHIGNEPITTEDLQYAKRHYVRDTSIDNMMHDFLWSIKDEHLGTVADWMSRNSTAVIPVGIVGNSVYQSNK